jgi:glyoxylase-like metal-dependent hydrolase (beta-lactamase superfamily II)
VNRLLLNLDAHPDRTLGARALDCTIVAHQKTAQVFRNRPTIFKGQNVETGAVWETYTDAIGMRWVPPDITFTQRMSLYWGGPEIVLDYRPGPTPGAIWVVVPAEKVVFVGDTVILDQPPFLASGDLETWLESLDLLLTSYRDYLIISGRGGPANVEAVRTQHGCIKNVIKGVERLAKRNAPPEATEELISTLLTEFSFAPERRERYIQRLRYGLHHYFTRRYRPASALEEPSLEDDE